MLALEGLMYAEHQRHRSCACSARTATSSTPSSNELQHIKLFAQQVGGYYGDGT